MLVLLSVRNGSEESGAGACKVVEANIEMYICPSVLVQLSIRSGSTESWVGTFEYFEAHILPGG